MTASAWLYTKVAPSRGRGLKLVAGYKKLAQEAVAPSRGRGLKPVSSGYCPWQVGRPFTGAWIETDAVGFFQQLFDGRPFTGAWIETPVNETLLFCLMSPLHGGVD